MSNATVIPTVVQSLTDVSERKVTYYGTLAVSADPDVYVSGGNTLSFAGKVPHAQKPDEVRIWSETLADLIYRFQYVTGTTIANGKVIVITGAAGADAELAAAAIPAAISGDAALRFKAIFKKGQ